MTVTKIVMTIPLQQHLMTITTTPDNVYNRSWWHQTIKYLYNKSWSASAIHVFKIIIAISLFSFQICQESVIDLHSLYSEIRKSWTLYNMPFMSIDDCRNRIIQDNLVELIDRLAPGELLPHLSCLSKQSKVCNV
jgi:hypothetical protein